MFRLQLIFLVLSVLVYMLAGVFGNFTRKERLIYAVTTYMTLVISVAVLLVLGGNQTP